MRGARAAGRERAVVFWMSERVYGGGERSRETERVHTERIAGSTAGCVVDRFCVVYSLLTRTVRSNTTHLVPVLSTFHSEQV